MSCSCGELSTKLNQIESKVDNLLRENTKLKKELAAKEKNFGKSILASISQNKEGFALLIGGLSYGGVKLQELPKMTKKLVDFAEPLQKLDLAGTWKDLSKQKGEFTALKNEVKKEFTAKSQDALKESKRLEKAIKEAKETAKKEVAESIKRDMQIADEKFEAKLRKDVFKDTEKRFNKAAQQYESKISKAASAAAGASATATLGLQTALSSKLVIGAIIAQLATMGSTWVVANELRIAIHNLTDMVLRGSDQMGNLILRNHRIVLDRIKNITPTNTNTNTMTQVIRIIEKVPVISTREIVKIVNVPAPFPVTNTVHKTDVRTVSVPRPFPVTNTVHKTDVRTVSVPRPFPVTNTIRTNTVNTNTNTINTIKTNTIIKTVPVTNTFTRTNTFTTTLIKSSPLSDSDLIRIKEKTCQAVQECGGSGGSGGGGDNLEDIRRIAANLLIDTRLSLKSIGKATQITVNSLSELMNSMREQQLLDFDSYPYKYPLDKVIISELDHFAVVDRLAAHIPIYLDAQEKAEADREKVKADAIKDTLEKIQERRLDSEAPDSLTKLPYLYTF